EGYSASIWASVKGSGSSVSTASAPGTAALARIACGRALRALWVLGGALRNAGGDDRGCEGHGEQSAAGQPRTTAPGSFLARDLIRGGARVRNRAVGVEARSVVEGRCGHGRNLSIAVGATLIRGPGSRWNADWRTGVGETRLVEDGIRAQARS